MKKKLLQPCEVGRFRTQFIRHCIRIASTQIYLPSKPLKQSVCILIKSIRMKQMKSLMYQLFTAKIFK